MYRRVGGAYHCCVGPGLRQAQGPLFESVRCVGPVAEGPRKHRMESQAWGRKERPEQGRRGEDVDRVVHVKDAT